MTDKKTKNELRVIRLDMEKYIEKGIMVPMAWDKELTIEEKITMNEQDIIMALDNLKVLDVPRRDVIKFLVQEVKEIFGDKT